MNLHDLERIQHNHRKELEHRLEYAKTNLKNLDRMAEEVFKEIDRRASEDKESFSKVFQNLTAKEEYTISHLNEELGVVPYQGETDGSNLSNFVFKQPEADVALEGLGSRIKKMRSKRDATI